MPLTAVQFWGEDILVALGQAPEAAALAGRYLLGLGWCLIPAWAFMALRNFMGAVNRPEPALWITLAAIPANAVLAYALIYGAFGLPRLDLLGAGSPRRSSTSACARPRSGSPTRAIRSRNIACSAASGGPTGRCSAKLLAVGLPISGSYCWSSACLPRPRC